MPLSDPSHRPWVLEQLRPDLDQICTVVDVGAGFGGWREFLGPWIHPRARWAAVEIFEPYVERFLLRERYHQVTVCDVRELDPFPPCDLVIFGDVLEHMPRADAIAVWDRAREACSRLILGIPVRHYPQGESLGNPWEAHVEDNWSDETVQNAFWGIYAAKINVDTGAYLAKGLAG